MMKQATFGGGCFWCIEAVIQRINGVQEVVSGYSGGKVADPSYREVCYGKTGHAEVVQVNFDDELLSYEELLTIFMTSHDPTQLNGQGADIGTQYRSIILVHDAGQKKVAEKVIGELKDEFDNPIVTEVKDFDVFYPAEDYHQNYYNNNAGAGYCRVVIDPKVNKLRSKYADKVKEPVTG